MLRIIAPDAEHAAHRKEAATGNGNDGLGRGIDDVVGHGTLADAADTSPNAPETKRELVAGWRTGFLDFGAWLLSPRYGPGK